MSLSKTPKFVIRSAKGVEIPPTELSASNIIASIIATYYLLDMSYPMGFAQVLGVFQEKIMKKDFEFKTKQTVCFLKRFGVCSWNFSLKRLKFLFWIVVLFEYMYMVQYVNFFCAIFMARMKRSYIFLGDVIMMVAVNWFCHNGYLKNNGEYRLSFGVIRD